ncbi:hypothetical protein [Streptomyces sp. NPDC051561]|uniref:hypothetical protein n=1 Tax=Streptomyces sp. NPDC051561 TaxID=3365658 RepID=UPI00379D5175
MPWPVHPLVLNRTSAKDGKGDAMNRSASRKSTRVGLASGAALALTVLCASAPSLATANVAVPATPETATLTSAGSERACPVVYFDLGETLVHTAADGGTGYQPGAAASLRALRERHIGVGLITNVPPSWGSTDAERAARLKKEVDATWRDPAPFAWQDFGDRILTPRTEAERKPAPTLWQRATNASEGCRLVFQGETATEVEVAASLGFVPYQVGRPHRPAFLPAGLVALLAHLPRP